MDAPRPARRPADSADRRRPDESRSAVRRRPRPSRTGRTRSAASSARPTAARRSRRCCTRTRTPAACDVAFDPVEPDIVYAVLWEARQGPWENGALRGPGSGLFKSTDGGTTWRQLTQGLADLRARDSAASASTVAPSDPQRLFADRRADARRRHLPLRRRRRELGSDQRRRPRWRTRGDDFAEVKVDPEESGHRLHRQHRRPGSRPTAARRSPRSAARRAATTITASGSTRTTRTSSCSPSRPGRDHHRQRRETWSSLVQPADRAVLPRQHRQRVSLPGVRRPAGERLGVRREPRRRRADHVPRVASGRRRGVRLRRARPARTPTSSTAARSRATTAAPGRCRTVAPKPLRGGRVPRRCAPRR